MKADVVQVLSRFRTYIDPRDALGDNPLKLGCSLARASTEEEIRRAWPTAALPPELIQAWLVSRESRLFEDLDYGQWGLVLLSPEASADRTEAERTRRPGDYRPDDFVIGEFLGDLELLVMAPSEVGNRRIMVALPLDDRLDWYPAGSSLAKFLEDYLKSFGGKYWESPL
jgi:hypothetical protein